MNCSLTQSDKWIVVRLEQIAESRPVKVPEDEQGLESEVVVRVREGVLQDVPVLGRLRLQGGLGGRVSGIFDIFSESD